MSNLVQTCLVIVQLSTGEPVATMLWPDGPEARAVCEDYAPKWNKEAEAKGFRAECRPAIPCPQLKDPVGWSGEPKP